MRLLRCIVPLLAVVGSVVAVSTIAETRKTDTRTPSAPGGLTATARGGYVALRWSASTDNVRVAGYRVWRREGPRSHWSLIVQTQSLGYADTTVTPGKGYAYGVRAYGAAGNVSASSAIVTVTLPAVKPNDTGSVLWKADAESPLNQEWAEYSTATHCAITSDQVSSDPEAFRESSVVAQGSYAYEFVIHNGDNCYGARTEIGQALPDRVNFSASRLFNQGDDRWFAFQVRLGSDFPVSTPNWQVVAQWKQLASTTAVRFPMVALQVYNGAFYLDRAAGTATGSVRTFGTRLATAITNRWMKMSVHIKFSTYRTVGYVEIYGDPNGRGMRRLMRRTHFSTLATDALGNPVPSHSRIGIYRNPKITGTARLYYDGYTVATTRSAAEANAFAPVRAAAPRRRSTGSSAIPG